MKILAIRLKNLASIEGSYEINFMVEPLFSAGIFAISGPTGSGKSTILDALCLALFDKAPRFATVNEKVALADVGNDRIQQSDVRNILRKGAGEGFAEVEFIGVDGKRYLSRWTVYRARRKSAGSLQNQILQVKELDSDMELQGTKTGLLDRLVSLVGLTYDQFTRTVLLAQNDFATFLKSRDDVKAELLEKLTGTEVYSRISMSVYAHNKEAQGELSDLKLRMGEITLLDGDEVEVLQAEKTEQTEEREKAKRALVETEQKIKWQERYALLLTQKAEADNEATKSSESLRQAIPRFNLIRKIDSVQNARSLRDTKQNVFQSLISQRAFLKKASADLDTRKPELQLLLNEFKEKEHIRKTCVEELEHIEPEIRNARALDIELKTAEQNRLDIQKDLEKSDNYCLLYEKELSDKQLLLSQYTCRTELLNDWINKYSRHESMIGRTDLVLSLLDAAAAAEHKNVQLGREIHNRNESMEQLRETRMQQENAKEKLLKKKGEIREQADNLKELMDSFFIEAVREKEIQCTAWWKQLLLNKNVWADYQEVKNIHIQNREKQIAWMTRLEEKRKQLSLLISLADTTRRTKDVLEQMYNNARLSVSGDVSEMRKGLLPGKPCPVCGSIDHPHAENDGQQAQLAYQYIEQEYRTVSGQYEKHNNHAVEMSRDIRNLEVLLAGLEKEILDTNALFQQREKDWIARKKLLNTDDPTNDEWNEWFDTNIKKTEETLSALKETELAYNKTHEQWETVEKEFKQLLLSEEKQLADSQKIERKLQVLAMEYSRQQANLEYSRVQLNEAFARAKQEITVDDWIDLWENNHESFKLQLQKMNDLWVKKHRERDTLLVSIQKMVTESEALSTLLIHAREAQEKAFTALKECTEKQNLLKYERSILLAGKPVDEVESALREKVNNSSFALEETRKRLSFLQSECAVLNGRISQSNELIENLSKDFDAVVARLSEWLNTYTQTSGSLLTESELMDLLDRDSAWMNGERKELSLLQETNAAVLATLKERRTQLEEHFQVPGFTKDEAETIEYLNDLRKTLQHKNEEIESRLSLVETKFRIQQQNKGRLKLFETELAEKQTVADRWAKLNDLIGQATGEKFKIIAQGYTLNILLMHANKHLGYLSSRYKLQQVQGSLSLQVVDRDMGDEIRTVYSLSGGESFLISLALALGLSSLSSRNMKVESLFIDEGFGSLDSESLRLAMEALEQLKIQGRKIGVISHVHEMSERISTQITLNKMVNGKSRIEIIGSSLLHMDD